MTQQTESTFGSSNNTLTNDGVQIDLMKDPITKSVEKK